MKWVAVSDIIVTEAFLQTQPKQSKLNRIREYYSEYGSVDKPITLNKNNVLIDGYMRYVVLKENDAEYAKCEIINWIPKKRKVV